MRAQFDSYRKVSMAKSFKNKDIRLGKVVPHPDKLIGDAITGNLVFTEENRDKDFDKACKHILNLLTDAVNLYINQSFPTCTFLSITAIEEISKAHMGIHQFLNNDNKQVKRNKDPLFNHKSKHKIALVETVIISSWLQKAIGRERCKELLIEAHEGQFIELRENAIYMNNSGGKFVTPDMVIDQQKAKEILLLALECFDDQLRGYTNASNDLYEPIHKLIDMIIK